jgi:hypothetical protein
MRSAIAASVLLLAAPALANESPLKTDWEALLAGGCDLAAAHVVSDVEARVLRNLPYALKGYVFKSPELAKLYGADGAWYTPDAAAKIDFDPKTMACVEKLKKLEDDLAKSGKALPKAFAARFTAHHEAVVALRANTAGFSGGLHRVARTKTADGEMWELGDRSCAATKTNPEGHCNVLQLICNAATCLLVAPG